MRERPEEAAVRELRIFLVIARPLHHARRHARGLQQVHQRARGVPRGERGQLAVDQIALREAAGQRVERARARPLRIAERTAQRAPLRVGLDRDRAPLVLAETRIGVVRRGGRRLVARAARVLARHLRLEQLGPEEVQRRLHLRLIDVLTLAGAAAVIERGDQRRWRGSAARSCRCRR